MVTDNYGKVIPEFTLIFQRVTWGWRLKFALIVLFGRGVKLT